LSRENENRVAADQTVQATTMSPGTRANWDVLAVTSVIPARRACAAMSAS